MWSDVIFLTMGKTLLTVALEFLFLAKVTPVTE